MQGQVFKIHSDFYYINSENNTYECKIREVLKKQDKKILVGDIVEFDNGCIFTGIFLWYSVSITIHNRIQFWDV